MCTVYLLFGGLWQMYIIGLLLTSVLRFFGQEGSLCLATEFAAPRPSLRLHLANKRQKAQSVFQDIPDTSG